MVNSIWEKACIRGIFMLRIEEDFDFLKCVAAMLGWDMNFVLGGTQGVGDKQEDAGERCVGKALVPIRS